MGLPQPEGYLFWYTTSAILGLLTIINIISITIRYIARRSSSSLPQIESTPSSPDHSSRSGSLFEKDPETIRTSRQLSKAERFSRAFRLCSDKFIGLSTIPLPNLRWWVKRKQGNSIATVEVIWTIVYAVGCLVLSFTGTDVLDHKTYANQAGWISAAQMPLIIALAGKNNLISFLTGIGYEKLNFLHRAAGRVCFLGVWIHAGGYFYILGGFHSQNWATSLSRWGFTGLLAFTLLNVTSLRWVRQRIYEFFLITHILLAALTLAAFIMHWRAVDIWIYPGIGLWAADRLFRILRLFILNKLWTVIPSPTAANLPSTATLTLLTPSTLKISFQTPSAHLSWSAGQHFYVVMPGMARLPWEAHPFTASTIPKHPGSGTESGELTFIVRVRDGFTKRMKQQVDKERRAQGLGVEEECKVEVKAAVEGPYGHVRKMDMYDGVLVVAGGSGISFAVSHLLQVIRDAKAGKPHPRQFSIIWMVKSRLHLNWIAPILLAHASGIPSTLHVALHVHVTRQYIPRPSISLAPTSILPADPQQADDSWQDYLAKRAAEPPRRKSRLLSTMSWATWTDAFDTDGQFGPGTRRGSTVVLPGQVSRGSRGSMSDDIEKQDGPLDETFTWAAGYNEGETPRNLPQQQVIHPQSPIRKHASGAPSIGSLPEDEEEQGPGFPRSSLERSSFSRSIPRTSIVLPESPRRASLALPSPLNPSSRRGSAGILLATPPKRNISISIEEPFIAGRRRSSVHSAGSASSHGDSRRGSAVPHTGPRRKSSGLLHVTLPIEDDSPPADDEKELGGGMFNILPPTPLPDETAVLETPAPAFFEESPAFLEAPLMIKTSSQHSGISIRSISSAGTPTSSLAPLLRPQSPGGSSGIATPALSMQKTDLSMPSDPEHPGALLEQAFAESSQQRAKQSMGLEQMVHWHEGRADLYKVIEAMMLAVGKGATVNVEACGPRSLLDKTKDVVQELSDLKAVWNGETRVIYHAETFGW